MNNRVGVDIIVPVYNALDDVKLCIESIKRHTNLTQDRLILIDDKSPDENVFPYLKSIEENGVVVLQNEMNLGFSGTINNGLSCSDRDVIILNSDTIVTSGWIDKMVECAYSDDSIGTVTPFSNNATLCSIPNFCEENTIPYGLSIDDYAEIIARCSMKVYPKISVAHGFCTFIKREVIEKTGLFDSETFQRGYGEENDFAWRAEQLGYYHVLCDTAYIYHSGSESFPSKEKRKLMNDHQRILRERYPKQIHANDTYIRNNPHQYLRENVDIYARLNNEKKNLLYVVHLDFRSDSDGNIGGTQFHVKDLVQQLKGQYNVFVLSRDKGFLRLTAYTDEDRISLKFHVGEKQAFQPFHCKKIANIFENILKAFSIDIVHIHHIIGLSFDVFHLTKKMGIPLVTTLHDYYYICPVEKLLENGKTYCGGCGVDCNKCLMHEHGYAEQVSFLPVWRERCSNALSQCDKLFVPSQAAKDIYVQIYPFLEQKIQVVPHGMDRFADENSEILDVECAELEVHFDQIFTEGMNLNGWIFLEGNQEQGTEIFVHVEDENGNKGVFPAISVERQDVQCIKTTGLCSGFSTTLPDSYFVSGKLSIKVSAISGGCKYCGKTTVVKSYKKKEKKRKRVAFLGGFNVAKGSRLAYQIIKQSNDKYDWYIIGGIGDPDLLSLKNVTRIGWYKRENVGTLLSLNQIDLVCILPIWPETFCYTISEAELAGVPILATKMGALEERIVRDRTGWLVDVQTDAKDILERINLIFQDESEWMAVKSNCTSFKHISIADMCNIYASIYDNLPIPIIANDNFDAQEIYLAYAACNLNQFVGDSAQTFELIRKVNELDTMLNSINQSFEYKLLQYCKRINFPFKRLIKSLIQFAYRIYKKLK